METLDYASILRHASDSLKNEGRYNQADILRDAADAFAEQAEELAQLQAIREAAGEYLAFMSSKDGIAWLDYKAESERMEIKLASLLGENK
jgi:hypothetical protein